MNLVQEGLALGIPAPGPDAHQRPSAARIYRMWFGAEGAVPADQDVARKILNAFPREPAAAKINRSHHLLITEALAACGISQFLDLGCGYTLPRPQGGGDLLFAQNTHDVAQQHWRSAAVVYADINHDVVACQRSLLASAPTASRPTAVLADLTDMARLLSRLEADGHLTRERPVAVLLHDVLPWIPDDARVHDAVAYLRTWLPSGSALSITHATPDFSPTWVKRVQDVYDEEGIGFRPRDRQSIGSLFGDWADLYGGPVRMVPTARHQMRHRFSAVPDYISAAYAGVAVKQPTS
ncbi:SAM-dependent methyltransferase [Streptomyces roseus]|uniref:SAM-dependent methyltransferase n=1 Tax=Streptomyces roseus TaxID=66430 RepID=UPI00069E5EB5|nr:SAM-dependent methyltransferase [Streptomyces roseus]